MRKFLLILLVISLWLEISPVAESAAAPNAQSPTPQENAQKLLERLTPEERVGQLFLVTFTGINIGGEEIVASQIQDLIVNKHIGGVILQAANDNFADIGQTILMMQSLTEQLQRTEFSSSLQVQALPGSIETFTPSFIPLFIGISQNGDGAPYDQILSGVSRLPSQMALGATWRPDLAQKTGEVLGRELSILGINLMLGPSLDVLEPPFSDSGSDLGVRTFGGDPFWVAEMGKAFVTGLHQGSNQKLVVVGKYFPGFGGSDRLPEDEVATVRKNLEQLKQFELYPFFAVTGNAPTTDSTVDALLTAHIRYQGFQENFRATTKPISFDTTAFANLMALPALKTWRDQGGLMISDSLGSRAVRRFYDPTDQTFNGRTVALDAFLAGNDMLFLANFISSGDEDAYTTIARTLSSFALKYREDEAFAQRVDASVLRILTRKYLLYDGVFSLSNTILADNRNQELGLGNQITFEIASQAATLINPAIEELDDAIPGPNDRIIFLTDSRAAQQCSTCDSNPTIAVNALEQAVLRLYSPQAGGPIQPANLSSHSFQELQQMLIGEPGTLAVDTSLQRSNWIVILMQDINPNIPSSLAFRQLLDQRPDLLLGKHIIVFVTGAPYYLDATEISKFNAYYALYSRSPQFIEVAARLLLQEIRPMGNLPVSVPEIGYDINLITFPDPNQVIELFLDLPQPESVDGTPIPTVEAVSPLQNFRIGDPVPLRTGIILDHNGHPVPDGAIVRFILTHGGEQVGAQQGEAQTFQGVALAVMRIDASGNIEIRVESDPAKQSTILHFVVPPENITATPSLTPTPTPTETPTPTATIVTPTVTLTPTPQPTPEPIQKTGITDWFVSLVVAIGAALLIYGTSTRFSTIRWGIRQAFLAFICALLAYSYLALSLPGSQTLINQFGLRGSALLASGGALLGWIVGLIWRLSLQTRH